MRPHRLLPTVLAAPSLALMALLGLSLAACPRAGTDPQATTATAAPSPPWWMSLKDGELHRGLDEAPIGLYAPGDMEGDRFMPGGDIEGDGPIGAAGTPGWLDLRTGRFIAKGEPQPPPPFIEGAMTPSGFSPKSRKVTY
jgi:hypothetical protein